MKTLKNILSDDDVLKSSEDISKMSENSVRIITMGILMRLKEIEMRNTILIKKIKEVEIKKIYLIPSSTGFGMEECGKYHQSNIKFFVEKELEDKEHYSIMILRSSESGILYYVESIRKVDASSCEELFNLRDLDDFTSELDNIRGLKDKAKDIDDAVKYEIEEAFILEKMDALLASF